MDYQALSKGVFSALDYAEVYMWNCFGDMEEDEQREYCAALKQVVQEAEDKIGLYENDDGEWVKEEDE